MKGHHWKNFGVSLYLIFLAGCYSMNKTSGNIGDVQSYPFPSVEAQWIKNGEPVEYQGELWYPQNGIEALLDSEVYLLGEYKNVQFFAEKIDVFPLERIYTKFGRNKFRYYEKHKNP